MDRFGSAHAGEAQVQDHHVGTRGFPIELFNRAEREQERECGGIGDCLDQALPEYRVVLNNANARHRGAHSVTLVPFPGSDQMSDLPPTSSILRKMELR